MRSRVWRARWPQGWSSSSALLRRPSSANRMTRCRSRMPPRESPGPDPCPATLVGLVDDDTLLWSRRRHPHPGQPDRQGGVRSGRTDRRAVRAATTSPSTPRRCICAEAPWTTSPPATASTCPPTASPCWSGRRPPASRAPAADPGARQPRRTRPAREVASPDPRRGPRVASQRLDRRAVAPAASHGPPQRAGRKPAARLLRSGGAVESFPAGHRDSEPIITHRSSSIDHRFRPRHR